MICIIDYGVGNLRSVQNMIKKAGADEVIISSNASEIKNAKKLILPGVGNFDYGMTKLLQSGLLPSIEKRIFVDQIPILGICLGAQLMTRRSDEGKLDGLSWINGETVHFNKNKLLPSQKIPHMGWDYVNERNECSLFFDIPKPTRYYFVHSFHLVMDNPDDIWLTSNYGYEFCVAFYYKNIYGCQFHPEKSHIFGLKLFKNFIQL